jgi:hypothetical protein
MPSLPLKPTHATITQAFYAQVAPALLPPILQLLALRAQGRFVTDRVRAYVFVCVFNLYIYIYKHIHM